MLTTTCAIVSRAGTCRDGTHNWFDPFVRSKLWLSKVWTGRRICGHVVVQGLYSLDSDDVDSRRW